MSLAPNLKDYTVTQASRLSPRVIAEHRESTGHVRRRIVVDLRSGRQIASFKTLGSRCALSPDGDFLAEGGDGSLTLYQLP